MEEVFAAYRPLRNLMRNYRLEDALAVVRAYSQNLAYAVPFPSDIEVMPGYQDLATRVQQWELEIFAREAIAHAPQYVVTAKTLRRSSNLITLLQRLRDLENYIDAVAVNPENVGTELHRIGHRQFEWQSDIPRGRLVLRYYKIFSQPAVNAIVAAAIGLDTRTLYLLGFYFTGFFFQWFALNYPPTILISNKINVTVQQLDTFLAHFSRPVEDLSRRIKDELRANMNENYAYFFDALRTYPLVDMRVEGKRSVVAPLPVLVTWRFTRGLYYELFNRPGFDQAFGAAFQQYVGEVLHDLFDESDHVVLPEEPTANDRGIASSDWFLVMGDAALIIESKTKRLGLAAKVSLNDTAKLDSELGKLADGILQTYKCIDAIQQGTLQRPDYAALQTKQFYPVIVTLESWHIFGPTWRKLNELVQQRLRQAGLPKEWTASMPFTACDINEFEYLAQAIQAAGSIGSILDERLASSEFQQYELYTYLFTEKKTVLEQARELFPNQFENLFA